MSISVLLVWTVVLGVAHVGLTVGAIFYLNNETRAEAALDVAGLRAETIAMQQHTQAQIASAKAKLSTVEAVATSAHDTARGALQTATTVKDAFLNHNNNANRHNDKKLPRRRSAH